jgi:hypothetical protein
MVEHYAAASQDVLAQIPDLRLRAQEKEFADKSQTCWRLTGYGTLFVEDHDALSCFNAEQAAALRPAFRTRMQEYVKHWDRMSDDDLVRMYNGGTVQVGKGKGAPYWNPGSDVVAALALGRIVRDVASLNELRDAVMSAGAATVGLLQTSYIRVQGSRKVVPTYTVSEGRIIRSGERLSCKIRRIGAQPFATNHLWAGVGEILRTAMASIDDEHTGTVDPVASAADKWPLVVAFDLAAYDSTVGIETLDAFHEEMLVPLLYHLQLRGVVSARESALLQEIHLDAQRMPILLPPRDQSEIGYVAQATGQIRSGINLTSWIGTEINNCRIRSKAKALGIKHYKSFNYGDDTIMCLQEERQARAWQEADDMFGFNETVAPDRTFLMKRVPQNYSYLLRMLFACINREGSHEPQTEIAAAAAMRTRYELLRGHPLQSEFPRLLASWQRSSRWTQAVNLAFSGPDALELTRLAAAMQMLTQPARQLDDLIDDAEKAAAVVDIPALEGWVDPEALARHRMSVEYFGQRRDELTYDDARRALKQRSYTIPH